MPSISHLPLPDAFLVVNGELPSAPFLRQLLARAPRTVAADGAALRLAEATGTVPSTAVGDGDSIAGSGAVLLGGGMEFVLMPDQESGDLEKSLGWLKEQGAESLWLAGVTGRNPDHALNNLSVLARWATQFRHLLLLHDSWWGEILAVGSVAASVPVGTRVSLLPVPRAQLTTSGLRWALHNEVLEFGVREGASNEAVEPEFTVEVHTGALMLYVETPPALPAIASN